MISFKVSALFLVLVTICNCDGEKEPKHAGMRKIYKECLELNGFTHETFLKTSKEYLQDRQKFKDTPKELFCALKCIDEKTGSLKDGKFNVNNIRKHASFISNLKTPEEFLKCVEQIDGVKECEDYRKMSKCVLDVGETYERDCALKLNNQNMTEGIGGESSKNRNKYRKCLGKCILESKGILGKDGKIDMKKAAKDIWVMSKVKKNETYLNCLKDLEIKKCEDISKMWKCKMEQH